MPNETYYYATGSEITSIADAIREKSGTNTQLEFPDDFVEAINNISGDTTSWETIVDTTVNINETDDGSCYYTSILNNYYNTIDLNSVWRVTWNGSSYICIVNSSGDPDGDPYAIGNQSIVGVAGGNNEPFMIQRYWGETLMAFSTNSVVVHIILEKQISASGLIPKTITENGTYNPADDNAIGYSEVIVNVGNEEPITEIIVPEQTITVSGPYTQINFEKALVEGEEYIYTVNETSQTSTAENVGSIILVVIASKLYFDYDNGQMYLDVIDSSLYGTYTVKVEKVISSGGGGSVSPKQVNFIDYDGTVLYAYTATEANALTALPANPSHDGLTAQGWNWTLQQIKAQLTAMPDAPVWVGQMYITSSGKTEIDVTFADSVRLSPILTIAVNGTITVDWGDDTTPDTVTGSSLTTRQAVSHTYASIGDYTILISVTSGSFSFYGDSSYTILRKNTTGNENRVYANCIQHIRLGNGITSIGNNAFSSCYSLANVSIPSGVTSLGSSAFSACYSLTSVTIPNGVTSIGNSAFNQCYSLASITIPSEVTSIGSSTFNACYSLASITIPSGVTSIGGNAFYYCYSLASITIPSGVTSIGNSAFSYCYGMKEYHIKPTTLPTGGTTMFNYIVSDCIIYVPSAKLNDYKTATNWLTYADYMQGE